MQETVTMTKDELQEIVAQALRAAGGGTPETRGRKKTRPRGPEISDTTVDSIRRSVAERPHRAVVVLGGDGYKVYSFNVWKAKQDRGLATGERMREVLNAAQSGAAA